jgi:hypothetical protein
MTTHTEDYEGEGTLTSLQDSSLTFKVRYDLTTSTQTNLHRISGDVAVRQHSQLEPDSTITATDGRAIPEGEYLLKTPEEIMRLKNICGLWQRMSWPPG